MVIIFNGGSVILKPMIFLTIPLHIGCFQIFDIENEECYKHFVCIVFFFLLNYILEIKFLELEILVFFIVVYQVVLQKIYL